MKRIYFDNAASTPLEKEVVERMSEVMMTIYGNPSSIHQGGRIARTLVEEARKIVADSINASIGEIFFTSCGTESNNMILKGAVNDLDVKRIISTKIEHHCILNTLDRIDMTHDDVEIFYLNVNHFGEPDLEKLEELLSLSNVKTLVSLMHCNNELGTMISLKRVREICKKYDALFHSDTVQTIGQYDIDVANTNIHFLAASSHKFYGPKGVGFVYISNDVTLNPFIDGGAQERNMRGGTENIYGIAGLSKALELAISQQKSRRESVLSIKEYMKKSLTEKIDGLSFNGNPESSSAKVLSVNFLI